MKDDLRTLGVMIELELRRLKHERTELYYRAVQPLLWIVVFGPIIGAFRIIPAGFSTYTDFITPGAIIQSTTFVSIFFGLNMVMERESGILKKLLVTPASRFATVIGRSMASGVRAIFQALLVLPIGLIVGVTFYPNPFYFLIAFLVIFLAAGGFAAISIFIASFLKSREKFMGMGQAIMMPLFFLSNALYPIESMPPVLQTIALGNPMTYVVEAVRNLMITGDLSNLLLDVVVLVVFDVVMFIIASLAFKKIIQ
jgi:ABC-2 type transport system permease protein